VAEVLTMCCFFLTNMDRPSQKREIMSDCHRLLPEIVKIARAAAEKILEIYHSGDFGIEAKADNSPLTLADKAAHDIISRALATLTPDWPVLSEESEHLPFAQRAAWPTYWLVDPLDGTREFIKRNGEFTVNIALIDAHQPVLGVVYVPVSGICYAAAQGVGGFKYHPDGRSEALHVRAVAPGRLIVVGSRSHSNARTQSLFDCLNQQLPDGIEIAGMGSSLKLCLVAEGAADFYPRLGPTSEWDTAAAQCVVEQAGGQVTGLNLQPLRYNTQDSLRNPYFLVFGAIQDSWRSCLAEIVEKPAM
jgi:3'(2'), 5'-bisphosphate nucleotidase